MADPVDITTQLRAAYKKLIGTKIEAGSVAAQIGQGTIGDRIHEATQKALAAVKDKDKPEKLAVTEKLIAGLKGYTDVAKVHADPKNKSFIDGLVDKVTALFTGAAPDAKAAGEAYTAGLKTATDKSAELGKAFDTAIHYQVDALDDVAKKALLEGEGKKNLGALGKLFDTDFLSKTFGFDKEGKFMAQAASNVGRWAKGGVGVAVAGVALRQAFKDKGVDEQTGEKKKMGFFGKIVVGLCVIGGGLAAASAMRNGNFVEGFKQGEGVIGKFTAALKTGVRWGAAKGGI